MVWESHVVLTGTTCMVQDSIKEFVPLELHASFDHHDNDCLKVLTWRKVSHLAQTVERVPLALSLGHRKLRKWEPFSVGLVFMGEFTSAVDPLTQLLLSSFSQITYYSYF